MNTTSHLLLDLYRGARELPVPEFQEEALLLLKSHLRFDSAMWGVGEVRPDTGLAIQCIHLHNQPEEMLASYEEIKDLDRAAYEAARRVGEVCSFNIPEVNAGAAYAGPRAHSAKYDIQNLIVLGIPDRALASFGFVSLWRAKERDRYTEDERRLGELLIPHLIEASTINRLLWLNQVTGGATSMRGSRAIADMRGELHACDDGFVTALRKEWGDWTPPILPAALRDLPTPRRRTRFVGKRIAVATSVTGTTVFLRIEAKSSLEALTAAERTAAVCVATGLSYKEAARELGLSPATVRNQLHSVYGKLGITNKAALAHRLAETRDGG